LAEKVFERIKNFIPNKFELIEYEKEFGALCQGKWLVSHINHLFRVCKYQNEGFFGPHYDGVYMTSEDVRSFYTLMFYLNEEYEGGETAFLDREDHSKVINAIKPKAGMMIFFPQNIYHEGRAVKGEKYIFRTDIMYNRDFDGEGKNIPEEVMSNKKQALIYLEMAYEFERCKQGMKAVEFYRKAFKLDPDLEKVTY